MGIATPFTVRLSSQHNKAGLSLRGYCSSAATAQQLQAAINELVATGLPFVWVDCRYLGFLSWHAQRVIFNAHQQAKQAGCTLYWCGFSPAVLSQLAETGLHLLLNVLPASSYQGPPALLQETGARPPRPWPGNS
jgi:anti-anti-sigma regulatory factor